MNYGKRKAAKQQKKITSKSTMQGKRVGVRLLKAFLLCLILVAVIGVVGGGLFVKRIIDNAPEVSPSDVKPQGFTTFVYADDGKTETHRFVASGSNRVYKTIQDIPENLAHAFVAIEDERFYKHNGIDLQGIARAAVSTLTGSEQGASTLTQQLIKNNVFPNFVDEKTFSDKLERKFQEQYLALQIEKQMSKEEILESYMNTINLGQNCLGVQSAAMRYFGKDVSKLTLSECAVIAGITQNPARYNPVTHPDYNAKRREKVLGDMLKQGYITEKAYNKAMKDKVYARIQKVNKKSTDNNATSYFVDALSDQVIHDLKEQLGYTDAQAYNALYSGGLSIYSTQNKKMQTICDEEMNKDSNYPGLIEYGLDYALTVTRADGSVKNYSSGHIKKFAQQRYGKTQGLLYSSKDEAKRMVKEWKKTIAKKGDKYNEVINITPQPQASVTLMDQSTGEIKAMVGGRGTKGTSLSLNRAYKGAKRQPGSTFKVLAAYAPAIDACGKTLTSTVVDEPYTYKNGKSVRNASGSYKGTVTYRTAIANSINVCAVKVSDEITQELGYEYCKDKFGITTLVKNKEINGKIFSDINQTLALGGITEGVYNYQLCAAYASIANGGEYNTPTLYTKIVDHDGNVLLENPGSSHRAVKESTASLLTSALQSVVQSGTGRSCQLNNMPTAGKTGTTTSNKDLWFCGFTPYYTCAVWGGYDDNKACSYDTSFRFRLWNGIMSRIHENLEYKDFDLNAGLEQVTVCSITGKLPRSGCPTETGYFTEDTIPTETCPGHSNYSKDTEKETPDDNNDGDGQTTENPTKKPDSNNNGNNSGGNSGGGNSGGGNSGGGTTGGGDNSGGGNTGGGGNSGGGNSSGGNSGGGNSGGGNSGGGNSGGNETGGGNSGGETGADN